MRDYGGLDQGCTSRYGEKWLHSGSILKLEFIRLLVVDVGLERKREIENAFKLFGLSNWKDGFAIS